MIGLSLSFCVRDILDGKVELDDVEKIIAGTRIHNEQDLEQVVESYMDWYWNHNPRALAIVAELFRSGRLEQPRCQGKNPPNISDGHWKEVDNLE